MDAPQRWEKLGWTLNDWGLELVRRGGEKFHLQPVEKTWESLALFLFSAEQSSRKEVDAVIQFAARNMRLQDSISPKARFFLGYRIMCAHDFFGMAFPPESQKSPIPDVPASWSDAQIIQWLLVDLWQRRHDHWIKLSAIGLVGPFGFYGIGEADPNKKQ
jgi:hypothetical protein